MTLIVMELCVQCRKQGVPLWNFHLILMFPKGPLWAQSRLSSRVAVCSTNTLWHPLFLGCLLQGDHTQRMWRHEGLSEQGDMLTVVQPLAIMGCLH